MKKLGDVSDLEFDKVVLESDIPVLVDFWADWCMPCHALAPIVDDIANERNDIKVFKLNIDENPENTRRFSVMSVPQLLLFENGELKTRVIGVKNKETLLKELFSE